MRNAFSVLLIGLITLLFACEEKEGEDVGGESDISGTSHNTGKNCFSCHAFSAAGSVYNKALSSGFPGAVVKLTTQANGAGTVLGTFTVNKSGSFYTSSAINFGTGIYVSVAGSSGSTKYMSSSISTGACNSCHGSSTSKVWAE
jgi:hypothetical protein